MSWQQSIRHISLVVFAAFVIGALCVTPEHAAAQDSTRVIEVRAIDKTLKTSGRSPSLDIGDTTIEIKPRQTLSVKIVDSNPLLLTYSATVTKEETEQHKTASEFLKEFAGWITAMGYKAPSTQGGGLTAANEKTLTVEGINFSAFQDRLKSLNARLESLESRIAESLGDKTKVDKLKADVLAWNAAKDATAFATDYTKIATIVMKCLQHEPLQTNQGTQILCSSPVPLTTDPSLVPTAPLANAPAAPQANTPTSAQANAQANNQANVPTPPGINPTGSISTGAVKGTIESYVTLAMSIRMQVMDSVKVVSGFSADVAKLHDSVEVAKVGYLATQDQKIEVKIAASEVYKAFLNDETKAKRDEAVKSFTITVSPYAMATWSLGAAVVVPVISNPTYTTEKSGDKFVIHSKEGDSQPYQIAAMLSIEPHGWREQVFGAGLQVGVSPAKERIALYVGPHIRLYDVSIGGGLLLQRTTRLDDGLGVGQQLTAETDLKTNTRLRAGGYVQVSISLFKQ